ncbi:MAG: hypothetical protein IJ327_02490 [Lachnospiraceae bacterium]|nr:hypothetical protein [Lachnospiraceae bacterium]
MKLKKFLFCICSICVLLGMPMSVSATEVANDTFNSKEFIGAYYEAINEHDWESVSQFYDSESAEDMLFFLTNPENQRVHRGLLNVQLVEAVESVDVNITDAEYLLFEDYSGKIAATVVVGAKYTTYEDSEYYANGVCYEIYAVVYEGDGWKISEKRTVWDFEGLLNSGYVFNSVYQKTEEVVEARRDGVILNYEGEYVETVFDTLTVENTLEIPNTLGRALTVTSYAIPTNTTQITYYDRDTSTYHTKGFHDMCKAITYAEVGSDATFGNYAEARKACILAIKTYVWHFYITQESKDAAYHISDSQIAYNDAYKSTYGFLSDYAAVSDVWMQGTSSTGNPIVFEANLKKGNDSIPQDTYWHGGDLKQLGCIYLLKQENGITIYKDLLHYYYDFSIRSQGGPVQFFDSQKNFI